MTLTEIIGVRGVFVSFSRFFFPLLVFHVFLGSGVRVRTLVYHVVNPIWNSISLWSKQYFALPLVGFGEGEEMFLPFPSPRQSPLIGTVTARINLICFLLIFADWVYLNLLFVISTEIFASLLQLGIYNVGIWNWYIWFFLLLSNFRILNIPNLSPFNRNSVMYDMCIVCLSLN